MNIQGVIQTKHDQIYFWKLCGSIATVVIALTITWAFRQKVADVLLWRGMGTGDREKKEENYEV